MRLWLKCPACQAKNSLEAKVCAVCGASLSNLPLEQRVYILEPAGQVAAAAASPVPKPQPEETPAPGAAAPAVHRNKSAKASKRAKKKK